MSNVRAFVPECGLRDGGEFRENFAGIEILQRGQADGAVEPSQSSLSAGVKIAVNGWQIAGGMLPGHQTLKPFLDSTLLQQRDFKNAGAWKLLLKKPAQARSLIQRNEIRLV